MQGAFNTKTKRQLEICKRVPLKLDFEVKFKDARVAFPNPSMHSVLWQGVTKALLSCWLLSPLCLIQSLGPNDHLCISQRSHQPCKLTAETAPWEEGAAQPMFAQCANKTPHFCQAEAGWWGLIYHISIPPGPGSPGATSCPRCWCKSCGVVISVSKAPKEARTAPVTPF